MVKADDQSTELQTPSLSLFDQYEKQVKLCLEASTEMDQEQSENDQQEDSAV